MIKKILFIMLFFAVSISAIILSTDKNKSDRVPRGEKLIVTATFYPLGEFARRIGGDTIKVSVILPPGSEPHDFEPTTRDLVTIQESDIFIINGGGVDAWAENITPTNSLNIVNTQSLVQKLNSVIDPHIWLDPNLAIEQVRMIRDALQKSDPTHSNIYQTNANDFIQKLQELDARYRAQLFDCRLDSVLTSHEAFGYLAARYGFKAISISGISPDEEPSPAKLAELANIAKQKNIKYVFFETLVSPKIAQTLAQEIGAQTIIFNPLEGLTEKETRDGEDYISIMNQNLTNLRIALQCQ